MKERIMLFLVHPVLIAVTAVGLNRFVFHRQTDEGFFSLLLTTVTIFWIPVFFIPLINRMRKKG